MVDEAYMNVLVELANERFAVNVERTERFRKALVDRFVDNRKDADARMAVHGSPQTSERRGCEQKDLLVRLQLMTKQAQPKGDFRMIGSQQTPLAWTRLPHEDRLKSI